MYRMYRPIVILGAAIEVQDKAIDVFSYMYASCTECSTYFSAVVVTQPLYYRTYLNSALQVASGFMCKARSLAF